MRLVWGFMLLLHILPAAAQSLPETCPPFAPVIQLNGPIRVIIQGEGAYIIDNTPVQMPAGQIIDKIVWADDNATALLLTSDGDTDYRAYAYHADSGIRELLNQPTLNATRDEPHRRAVQLYNPVFIPDTRTVVANTEIKTDIIKNYSDHPADIWSLDMDSGAFVNLLPHGEGGYIHLVPDGSRIVSINHDGIVTLRPDGSDVRRLSDSIGMLGIGHVAPHPTVAWGVNAAGEHTLRAMVFVSQEHSYATYGIHEYAFGETITDTLINTGGASLFPPSEMSQDGLHVLSWERTGPAYDEVMLIVNDELPPVATVYIPTAFDPFARWADAYHIAYGGQVQETGETVYSGIVSICGDIIK